MNDVHHLQLFLRDFADNLRREYPVFMPGNARQDTIDVTSHTRWDIEIMEAFLGRLPTRVALAVLNIVEKELGKYGPASLTFTIGVEGRRAASSTGILALEPLTGASLNGSRSNENDNLQTE